MNEPGSIRKVVLPKPSTHLLDSIRAIRASVGDGLNDGELTRLLRQTVLPTEAGFAFLSFSAGFVTLSVPPQDVADWYPEQGWIIPAKEQIARAVARKYRLSLCEPPDESVSVLSPASDSPTIHHHLELTNEWETVIVAHPCYLKVRLFGAVSGIQYARTAQSPLPLGSELLQDLSALYQS